MQAEKASICCWRCAICAGVGWPPFGSSFSQAVRAELNAGEPGSIPVPEWILITPWPSGSGKFVTPCLRMQAENFAPSTVPTFIANWNCWPWPPPEPLSALSADREPLCVVVVPAVVVEEATLAIPGDPPLPPQPAASSAKAAATTTETRIGRRQRMSSAPDRATKATGQRDNPDPVTAGEQKLLPARNRRCGILGAGRGRLNRRCGCSSSKTTKSSLPRSRSGCGAKAWLSTSPSTAKTPSDTQLETATT